MTGIFAPYFPILDLVLIHCGLALSQYIVLRAGVFSVATAGFTSMGAYAAALLARDAEMGVALALLAALVVGLVTAIILALPLARVRGVYQAIATLAFVQIVLSLMYYAEDVTGGPLGLNAIPKTVGTVHIFVAVCACLYVIIAIGRSRLGSALDAIRQDEIVAASLGVSVPPLHLLAFALSGAIAGLFGGLIALHTYSIEPAQFGFPLLVSILAMVVLGGRRSVWGPIVGALILTILPELARPLAENRALIHGILLVVIIVFLPRGIVDSLSARFKKNPSRLEPDRDVAAT
ncbi:branched-chain amino acid transport system permease protein [Rhodoligotrophos appendicifer]|uniref:branched-chain amino acid ABC transporter permease n=1 Tax=Rhodoligotrophos appendicifer TaxID=987056 RepID=UPI0011852762|nr:branched-chain amino acid ABC transporter permease [Rhodoligotrophos appendicifer]